MTPIADRTEMAPPPFSVPDTVPAAGPPPSSAPPSPWPDDAYRGWASL